MDIPRPNSSKRARIQRIFGTLFLAAVICLGVILVSRDFFKARASDAAWESNLEKYVHVERAGQFYFCERA